MPSTRAADTVRHCPTRNSLSTGDEAIHVRLDRQAAETAEAVMQGSRFCPPFQTQGSIP